MGIGKRDAAACGAANASWFEVRSLGYAAIIQVIFGIGPYEKA